MKIKNYNGNPNLLRAGSQHEWTPEMVSELTLCASDVVHFAKKHFKIVHPDRGLIPFELYDFQEEAVIASLKHRNLLLSCSRQVGKCQSLATIIRMKCGDEIKEISARDFIKSNLLRIGIEPGITDEEIVSQFQIHLDGKIATDNDKIIGTIELDDWEVETDTGWEPVTHFHITKKYSRWVLTTTSGKTLEAADDHIVFDQNFCEVFVKDLKIGSRIQTVDGPELIDSIVDTGIMEYMFDITVDSENHRFYGNGILSHNTSIATVIILHFAIFNRDKTIAILANKGDQAREILHRIKLAYEYLPVWLKCGVVEWNKGSVEFENGCKIIAAASSSSAIRGRTCISGDTEITVRHKLTGEIITLSIEKFAGKLELKDNSSKYRKDMVVKIDEKGSISFSLSDDK